MYFVCTFSKVVSHYDLSVLSMLVIVFPKHLLKRGLSVSGSALSRFLRTLAQKVPCIISNQSFDSLNGSRPTAIREPM